MSRAALPLPVPSPRLLRFLRSQTDGLPSLGLYSPGLGQGASRPGAVFSVRHGLPRTAATAIAAAAGPRPQPLHHNHHCRPPPCAPVRGSGKPRTYHSAARGRPRPDLKASIFNAEGGILPYFRGRRKRKPQDGEADGASAAPRRPTTWQERLWGAAGGKGGKPLQSHDMGEDGGPDSNFTFSSRRAQLTRAPMDPRLRCTEVDENGEVILVDGEYKKSELIAKYGLLPRDLRKIDSSNLPHILVRPSAILLNLLHLRVLIKSDRVLLFDVFGSKTSYNQSAFMYDLQGKLQQRQSPGAGGLPYEFRALEAVLVSVTTALEADLYTVREPVIRVLRELEDDINRDRLRVLLVLSKKINTFEQKAKLVRDAIDELLEADDDLAAMYLTEKKHDLYRGEDDHNEVEMLLESYHKICDEVVQEAGSLVSSIRNTEEIIRAILDANRNALMLLDLKFSIGTLGLAMGTFLAGLYGMNLKNFIEESDWGFGGVTGISALFSIMVCWYGLIKLRKVQRVKMHSGVGGDHRAHLDPPWFREDGIMGGLLEDRPRERIRRLKMMRNSNGSPSSPSSSSSPKPGGKGC